MGKVKRIDNISPGVRTLKRANADFKAKLSDLLKKHFPGETAEVYEGFGDYLHAVVTSRKFDKFKTEKQKQDYLWKIIDESDLTALEKTRIIINPWGPIELK